MLCRKEGEIHQPQGVAKDVGLPIGSLAGDRVELAQDVRVAEVGEVLLALEVRRKTFGNAAMVHQVPYAVS